MSEWFLDVFVSGEPKSQGSMIPIGRTGKMRHKPEMLAWRDRIVYTLQQWADTYFGAWDAIDEPAEVQASFWMSRPKKPRLDHAATGIDLDKATRCVGDALEQSGVLRNDARIVRWDVRKEWTHDIENEDGYRAGVRVKVRKVE